MKKQLFSKPSTLGLHARNNNTYLIALATIGLSLLFVSQTYSILFKKIKKLPSFIYDVLIINMTEVWYRSVIHRLDMNSEILDIGIGTAGALLRCDDLIKEKNVSIVGIDYNSFYVDTARQAVEQQNMQSNISVHCMSVYETDELKGKKFDAAYFSGSFSLLPDPILALKHISEHHVKSNGRIYITQTFQSVEKNSYNNTPSTLISYMKPLLKYLTTIDFGYLITQDDILSLYEKSGLEILHHDVIPGSVNNSRQAAFLTVLKVP